MPPLFAANFTAVVGEEFRGFKRQKPYKFNVNNVYVPAGVLSVLVVIMATSLSLYV